MPTSPTAARAVKSEPGLVVTNPPYGLRLGGDSHLPALYALLGDRLKQHFDGWRAAVFTGNPDLGKRMGLRAQRFHTLYNGPVECRLLHFEISAEAHVSDKPRPLPAAERGPGAEMLANRLRKNQKGLRKWLRAEGISCYRLYDADLPEYALAIDVYGTARSERGQAKPAHAPARRFVQVQEYAAPASVDPRDARRRLREALAVIPEVLEVPSRTSSSRCAGNKRARRSTSAWPTTVASTRSSRTGCGSWSTSRTISTPACSWTIARSAA
jgi:23S rRNA (guanine2445-N2)-methyltransferase / 23S rRNA (guanine2069-N7)-methyltransferase